MKRNKLQSYTVMANLFVTMECTVRAESFEEASVQAKSLEASDFLDEPLSDCKSPQIISIYRDDSELRDQSCHSR